MQQEVKKQHYVPQFYLRKFGTGKKKDRKVYVFNKKTLEIKKDLNTKEIANENYFYDFNEIIVEQISKILNITDDEKIKIRQSLEIIFEDIEKKASPVFSSITNKIKNYFNPNLKCLELNKDFITSEERKIFSLFLALQYIRTSAFREQISCIYQAIENKIGQIIKTKVEKISSERKREEHLSILINIIKEIPLYFYTRMWFFHYNTTNKNLCTSDNPVYFIQLKDIRPYGVGLKTADIITFPITPKIILYMHLPINLIDKAEKKTFEEIDQEIKNLDIETRYFLFNLNNENDIEECNLNQAYHCQKEIYSLDGDFERIIEACKVNENNIRKSPDERMNCLY